MARWNKERMPLFCVLLFMLVGMLLPGVGWGQTAGDYRTKAGGSWSSSSTWERYNGTSWVAAADYPGQNAGAGTVTISNDVTLDVSPANSVSKVIVNAGFSLTINSTLVIDGDLILNAGDNKNNTIVTIGSTGKLVVRGGITLNKDSEINVNGTGTSTTNNTGGILIAMGYVDASNNGNINLANNGDVIFAGGASSSNIIKNSSTGENYIFPTPNGGQPVLGFTDLIKDPGLLDVFTQYACPSKTAFTLKEAVSGRSLILTADVGFTQYDFYMKYTKGTVDSVKTLGSVSSPQTAITIPDISISPYSNSTQFVVYAKSGTCFQAATATGVGNIPAIPTTKFTAKCFGDTSIVRTTGSSSAVSYKWKIVDKITGNPITTSFITTTPSLGVGSSSLSLNIGWGNYTGTAQISVTGINNGGNESLYSPVLEITVNPLPTPVLNSLSVCAGGMTILSTVSNYNKYLWTVTTPNYSIVNGTTSTPTLQTPNNDLLFPIGSTSLISYPYVKVVVTDSNGCSNTAMNNSTDQKIKVLRIPRTGPPYHIGNNVAK